MKYFGNKSHTQDVATQEDTRALDRNNRRVRFYASRDGNPWYDPVRNVINFNCMSDRSFVRHDGKTYQLVKDCVCDMKPFTTTSFILLFNKTTGQVRAANAFNMVYSDDELELGGGRRRPDGSLSFEDLPVFQLGQPENKLNESGDFGASISVAHRGYNRVCPEMSADSYVMAASYGMTAWEGDVLFTKDDVPVMHHDTTINRIARNPDGSSLASSVRLDSLTLAELNQYDWGIFKNKNFAGTKLLTFENWVRLAKHYGVSKLFVELKLNTSQARLRKLMDILKAWDMLDKTYWLAFNWDNFASLNTLHPEGHFIFLNGDTSKMTEMKAFDNGKRELWASPSLTAITADQAKTLRDNGFKLYLWTARTVAHITKFNNVFVDSFGQDGHLSIATIQKQEAQKAV